MSLSYKEQQEKARQMQAALVEAADAVEKAKLLANELGQEFTFMGRTYKPLRTITQGGHFDHEPSPHLATNGDDWEASSDEWRGSHC